MPLPIPVIAAGVSALGGIIGNVQARRQQKKANQFNLEMWRRNNEYNAPQQQMKRLQEAGLNPHLVYGSGASGAAGQAANAPEFEKMSSEGYIKPNMPETMSVLQTFTDWEIKKAQLDNLRAQNNQIVQDTLLKMTQQAQNSLTTRRGEFDLGLAKKLEETSLQAAQANLRKTIVDTEYTTNQDRRSESANQAMLRESTERILSSKIGREQTRMLINNGMLDGVIKQLDAELAKSGLRPGDNQWARAIERIVERLFPEGEGIFPNLSPKNWFK